MPELTKEQVREEFLRTINGIVRHWANTPLIGYPEHEKNIYTRCEGVAFSIMSLLDGCVGGIPGFIVAPCPHPEDKEFALKEAKEGLDEDEEFTEPEWYPENHEIEDQIKCDIGGGLHELLKNYK